MIKFISKHKNETKNSTQPSLKCEAKINPQCMICFKKNIREREKEVPTWWIKEMEEGEEENSGALGMALQKNILQASQDLYFQAS